MAPNELISLVTAEHAFFASLTDLREALLYGSALAEKELSDDVDIMLIPARELSEGEKVDLRQAVWEHLKGKLPVMLEVVTPTADFPQEKIVTDKIPYMSVYRRD
jgi:hypothetical protein